MRARGDSITRRGTRAAGVVTPLLGAVQRPPTSRAHGRWFQEMMSNQLKPIQTGFDWLGVCYMSVGGRGYVLRGRVSVSCK